MSPKCFILYVVVEIRGGSTEEVLVGMVAVSWEGSGGELECQG